LRPSAFAGITEFPAADTTVSTSGSPPASVSDSASGACVPPPQAL
jgi:hypothetical protein